MATAILLIKIFFLLLPFLTIPLFIILYVLMALALGLLTYTIDQRYQHGDVGVI